MTARDLLPDRLEHAKYAIIDALPSLEGNRVALIGLRGECRNKMSPYKGLLLFQDRGP